MLASLIVVGCGPQSETPENCYDFFSAAFSDAGVAGVKVNGTSPFSTTYHFVSTGKKDNPKALVQGRAPSTIRIHSGPRSYTEYTFNSVGPLSRNDALVELRQMCSLSEKGPQLARVSAETGGVTLQLVRNDAASDR